MLKKVIDTLIALAIGAVGAYGLLCLYAFFMSDRLLFIARESPSYTLTAADRTTTAADGQQIALYYLPSSGARYTLLYSHGQGEDIALIRPRLALFARMGYNILAYEYPGFGRSSGHPTEEGCYAAAQAAYEYLTGTLGVSPSQTILYGRSMGSGPTLYLAERYPVAGTVLQSPFVSAFRVQTGLPILPWDRFNNLARIPNLKAPLLLVHGLADEVIPVWHSRLLAQATRVQLRELYVPYAVHNNVIEMAREEYWQTLNSFTELLSSTPPTP
jgi:abhydrolase domain-containing protein 17